LGIVLCWLYHMTLFPITHVYWLNPPCLMVKPCQDPLVFEFWVLFRRWDYGSMCIPCIVIKWSRITWSNPIRSICRIFPLRILRSTVYHPVPLTIQFRVVNNPSFSATALDCVSWSSIMGVPIILTNPWLVSPLTKWHIPSTNGFSVLTNFAYEPLRFELCL
jgi:hypothetical protein